MLKGTYFWRRGLRRRHWPMPDGNLVLGRRPCPAIEKKPVTGKKERAR